MDKKLLVAALQKLITVYQWLLSPWLGSRCRYVPTCSDYARQAIDHHGAFKGLWLATRRICRCHPWGGHGHDPVPLNKASPDKHKPNTKIVED